MKPMSNMDKLAKIDHEPKGKLLADIMQKEHINKMGHNVIAMPMGFTPLFFSQQVGCKVSIFLVRAKC